MIETATQAHRDTARAADLYAALRRTGAVTVFTHERPLIARLRRLATSEGLALSQYTARGQRRRYGGTPRTIVNLIDPARPDYITAPDADKVAQ